MEEFFLSTLFIPFGWRNAQEIGSTGVKEPGGVYIYDFVTSVESPVFVMDFSRQRLTPPRFLGFGFFSKKPDNQF
jgi:hypothetical protein